MFSNPELIQRIQKVIEYSIHDHHVVGLTSDAARPTEDNIQALASVSLQTRYARPGTIYDTKVIQDLAKEQGLKLALPQVPVAFLDTIVLKPNEKQQGLEREIVHRIIDWAEEMGRLVEVSLYRDEEEEFYRSLGFQRITVGAESTMFYFGKPGQNQIEAASGGDKQLPQQKPEQFGATAAAASAQQRQQKREEQRQPAPLVKQGSQAKQQQPAPLAKLSTPYARSPTSLGAGALDVVEQQSQQTHLEGSCLLDFDLVLPWQEQQKQPPPPPSPLDAAKAAATAAWKQPKPQPGSGPRKMRKVINNGDPIT
jgi:GNAT superfamily N-acetyltransferase